MRVSFCWGVAWRRGEESGKSWMESTIWLAYLSRGGREEMVLVEPSGIWLEPVNLIEEDAERAELGADGRGGAA